MCTYLWYTRTYIPHLNQTYANRSIAKGCLLLELYPALNVYSITLVII